MNLSNCFCRFEQAVDELSAPAALMMMMTAALMGGNFAKVVQESSLQLLEDLQTRMIQSENTGAHVGQETKNEPDHKRRQPESSL